MGWLAEAGVGWIGYGDRRHAGPSIQVIGARSLAKAPGECFRAYRLTVLRRAIQVADPWADACSEPAHNPAVAAMTAGPSGGRGREVTTLTPAAHVTLREFDETFEAVKNWDRWGSDDQLGTLNYLTPAKVAAAATLVRSGRQVSKAIPMDTSAGPDNPSPVLRYVVRGHDIATSSPETFATNSSGWRSMATAARTWTLCATSRTGGASITEGRPMRS